MNDHWKILRKRMLRRGVRLAKALPEKNVRRSGGRSLTPYFNNARLIDQFLEIYGQDVKLFYSDVSIDTLIANASIPTIRPLKPSDANSDNNSATIATIAAGARGDPRRRRHRAPDPCIGHRFRARVRHRLQRYLN